MKIRSSNQVEEIRKQYPVGTRLVLDSMDDIQAPKPGTQATVKYVDDLGDIGCSWDTGCGLKLVIGEDSFHKVRTDEEAEVSIRHFIGTHPDTCPRCGRKATEENRLLALSRRLDVTVCENCGSMEAMEAFFAGTKGEELPPLKRWAAVNGGHYENHPH